MTSISMKAVRFMEQQSRDQHQSGTNICQKYDLDIKQTPKLRIISYHSQNKGHSSSGCFEKKTNAEMQFLYPGKNLKKRSF